MISRENPNCLRWNPSPDCGDVGQARLYSFRSAERSALCMERVAGGAAGVARRLDRTLQRHDWIERVLEASGRLHVVVHVRDR